MTDINGNDHMSLKDKLFLSPTEKYNIYGTFPWKMMINLFLIIGTTSQVLIVIGTISSYSKSEERFFHDQFVNEGDKTDNEFPTKFYLYSINDLINHIQQSINNYYLLKNISLEEIEYLTPLEETRINLELFYYNSYYNYDKKKHYPKSFMINKDDLGPFKPDYRTTLKEMLRITKFFQLNYTIFTFVSFTSEENRKCYIWDIKQIYSFEQRSHYSVSLKVNRRACSDSILSLHQNPQLGVESKKFLFNFYWLHLIVIFLSLSNIILIMKYLHRNAMIYYHLKSKYKKMYVEVKRIGHLNQVKQKAKWDLLTSKDKNKFFKMWDIIALIGNIMQFFGSILLIYEKEKIMIMSEVLIGFGCFIAYLSLGRYFEFMRDYNTIISTILKAIPNSLRYFFGVLPLFIGFILFGVSLFWRSERFTSIPMTFITLFAMMNGDSVLDIIKDLKEVNFFLGQIYAYLFGILFIAIVMNVFVSIVEEAYVDSKMKNQNHWIYAFLKKKKSAVELIEDDSKKNNEEQIEMRKGSIKLYEKVRSKAILREAITLEMSREEESNRDLSLGIKKSKSMNIDNNIDQYSTKIDKAIKILEFITKEVLKTNESKMKSELKAFIKENIVHLIENKIKVIEEAINS